MCVRARVQALYGTHIEVRGQSDGVSFCSTGRPKLTEKKQAVLTAQHIAKLSFVLYLLYPFSNIVHLCIYLVYVCECMPVRTYVTMWLPSVCRGQMIH